MGIFTIQETDKGLYCRPDNNSLFYEFSDALSNSRCLNRLFIKGEHVIVSSWFVREYRDNQNSVVREVKEVAL